MFHAMVRFTLIILSQLRMLARGVNHKWEACPRRQHPSTGLPTYQIIKVTNVNHMSVMKTSLMIIPMCPREHFPSSKSLFRFVLCYKKYWAILLHLIYFHYLLPITNYLIIKLSVTDNFSACREYLTEICLSFPFAPRWVRQSYLSKGLRQIPYTCGPSGLVYFPRLTLTTCQSNYT